MNSVSSQIAAVLQYRLIDLPQGDITVGATIIFLMILVLTAGLASFVRAAIRRLRQRVSARGASLLLAERLVFYLVIASGIVMGLATIGFNLNSLSIFAGAVGVGIGLGIQGVVKEFVSGLTLITDNVLRIDDFIELPSGVCGQVTEIGNRATCLRTNDGVDVLVPNSQLITDQVINWTRGQHTRRIHVPFHVAQGSNLHQVRKVVIAAAQAVEFSLPDEGERRTQVWLVGLGESALNFELIVWPYLDAVKRPAAMQAAYTWAIAEALRAHHIEMPFPQQDLHVRSVLGLEGQQALQTLGFTLAQPVRPRPVHRTHYTGYTGAPNDAADDVLGDRARDGVDEPQLK